MSQGDPERSCEACGKRLERKREPSGRIEKRSGFLARRTCGMECRDEMLRREVQESLIAQGVPETKTCPSCGTEFSRPHRYGLKQWKERRFCSFQCAQSAITWEGQRTCEGCGQIIPRTRKPCGRWETPKAYAQKRYCSVSCASRATNRHQFDPHTAGSRTLLARTCRDCGLLLDGERFPTRHGTGGVRQWQCKRCLSKMSRENASEESREKRSRTAHEHYAELQSASLPGARRYGMQWTSLELEIVEASEHMTAYELAERLGRSFAAVQGFRSAVKRGTHPLVRWRDAR